MKTIITRFYLIVMIAVVGISCDADLEIDQTVEEIKSAQPTITQVNPSSAAVNSTVTIEGTFLNFATKAFIGDVEAQITSRITGQRLEIQVPNNAVQGIVKVVTEQGKEASSEEQLAITYPVPLVTGTFATDGFVNETITIQGSDLTSVTNVSFGNVDGFIEFQESQALVVRIPNNPGVQEVTLTYLSTAGPVTETIAVAFEIILPQPTIGGFPSIFSRDNEVIVSGQDMNLITEGTLEGEALVFTTQTPTEIRFMVPSSVATGYVDVVLNFEGGGVITRDNTPYINGQYTQIFEFDADGLDSFDTITQDAIVGINGNVEQPPFPGTQYFAGEMPTVTGSTAIRARMERTFPERTADILEMGNYSDNPVLHFWMHTEGTDPNFAIYVGGGSSPNRRTLDTTDFLPGESADNVGIDLDGWNLYAVRLNGFIPNVASTAGQFELRISRGSDTGGVVGDAPKLFNFDWFIVTDKVLTEFEAIDVTDLFDPAG